MKSTYLVFDGMGQLRVATKEEWDDIVKQNKSLPIEQRRFFIKDCFIDCGIEDCLYIETTKKEYDKWHSANQVRYKKRKDASDVVILSGDVSTQTEDGTLMDTLSDGVDWERLMIDNIQMKELRAALATWRSWAVELLDMYMDGMKTEASRMLSKKYGVTQKTIRKRKRALEAFIINFLK